MISVDARESLERLAHNPAVVTIDLHRGHLDPEVAIPPLPADAAAVLVQRVVPRLDRYRELGLPVVHVVTSYRNRDEILGNAYRRFQSERRGSAPRDRLRAEADQKTSAPLPCRERERRRSCSEATPDSDARSPTRARTRPVATSSVARATSA